MIRSLNFIGFTRIYISFEFSLNENNLNNVELPYFYLIGYCEQQCYGN